MVSWWPGVDFFCTLLAWADGVLNVVVTSQIVNYIM